MDPFYIIPPAVAVVIYLSLLFLVLRKNWRSFLHRIFGLFLLNILLWALFILCFRLSPDVERAYIWELAVFPLVYGAGIFFYHFTTILTNIRQKPWFLTLGYLSWIVFTILVINGQIITGVKIGPYGYIAISTPLINIYMGCMYFFVFVGLYNLIKSYRTTSSTQKKNQVAYVIAGVIFSLLGGVSDLLPILGLSTYPMGILANILFGLFAAVAILKYRLLDIQVVIRRSLAYIITSTIVAIPYIAIILMFNYIFGAGNIPVWAHVVLLLLLALMVPALWRRAQQAVDRLFFRESYDFLRQLEAFSQETHDITDLRQLSNSVVNIIKQALRISSIHLLLLDEKGEYATVASVGDTSSEPVFTENSPVIQWLRSNKEIIDRRLFDSLPQTQVMPSREKQGLEDIDIEMIVPLKAMTEELIGILILGKKISEQPYLEDDRRLISTVASQAGIELENARLYAAEMATRHELQRQNDQKTEFLHTVAHELKTPLTSLIAAIELMLDEPDMKGPQRQRLLNILENSTQSMDRRISELLVLAKVQTGELELVMAPLDINVFLTDIASRLTILFEQKKQSLNLEIDKAQSIVNADKDRLEQIIFNLITNAIKYSPTHAEITLRARSENGKVIIEIQDSAPVIDEEERKQLFDPYYRGHNVDEKEHLPGLGLGLYLVKRLVDLHEGDIWVDRLEGQGNIFAFSLNVADGSNGTV